METTTRLRPHLILAALFLLTGALLLFTVEVRESDLAGIRSELPDHLEDQWVGYEVLFCQDLSCGRSWLVKDLEPEPDGSYLCPENRRGEPCGAELDTKSIGENLVLPSDTIIFKKQYFNLADRDQTVFVSVVLSGKDRTSIHRPEICMPTQGNTIETREVIDVPLADRDEPLQVMVLNMTTEDVRGNRRHSYYAYWFVGNGRETPHHWERMLWMSSDRVLHNVSHRWAYIGVSGQRTEDLSDTSHHREIQNVIGALHPELVLEADPGA